MTESARRFVTPLTFETLSGQKVRADLFEGEEPLQHLSLAENQDLILVAPATANIIGKMAQGMADDLLSTLLLASPRPIVVAPAMDGDMWENEALQSNLALLQQRGITVVPPEKGLLASGREAVGRLASDEAILGAVGERLAARENFKSEVFLVTAGPTREPVDPIRFISNRSSGKMGYAVARAALDRGARVILVSGPVGLPPPSRSELVRVETAEEMRRAVLERLPEATVVVMTAAVSDYRPRSFREQKIRRTDRSFALTLEPTKDILAELSSPKFPGAAGRILVGFAAEAGDPLPQAIVKLRKKRLDLIVANDVTREGAGFDSETNIVTLMDRTGGREDLPKLSKREVAERILDRILILRQGRQRFRTGARLRPVKK
jgi:phosphopantothenoylcysteine decarboxylase/phosphopantothenate--cysteine ligase